MRKIRCLLLIGGLHLTGITLLKAETPHPLDTLTNWSISYNDEVIIRGNENGQIIQLKKHIRIQSPQDQLLIDYRYDTGSPQRRTITIKDNTLILYQATQQIKDDYPYSIIMQEFMNLLKTKITQLDIYYTDDRMSGKVRRIAQIQLEK